MSASNRDRSRAPMRRRYCISLCVCVFAWLLWPITSPAYGDASFVDSFEANRSRTAPLDVTQDDRKAALTDLYFECLRDLEQPRTDVDTSPGPGAHVAILGDSITSQIRTELVWSNTEQYDLVVWARCGADTASVQRDRAVEAVLKSRPSTLVVALGTNDTSYEHPVADNAQQFAARVDDILDQAGRAGVQCVAWVDVAATSGHGHYQAEAAKLDAELRRIAAERRTPRVIPIDWDGAVRDQPGLVFDGVHLSQPGIAGRLDITHQAIDACQRPRV